MESYKKIDKREIPNSEGEIRLFLVARNEMLRLPYWFAYYRKLGVDRFFVVDNASLDDSQNYLLKQSDTHVFYTEENFSNKEIWLKKLMDQYGIGLLKQKGYVERKMQIGEGSMVEKLELFLDMDAIARMSIADIILGRLPDSTNLIAMATDCGKTILRFQEGDNVHFTEKYKFRFPNAEGEDVCVELKALIDSSFLKIVCHVENKTCICFEGENNDPRKRYRKKDGVQVMIVKEDYIVHRLFTMAKNDSGYYVICSSNNWSKVINLEETEVTSSFSLNEHGFGLELMIPWAYLDIDVHRNKVVPFNICAVVADPVVNATARTCSLLKGEGDFWDFRGVGGLEVSSHCFG